MESRSWRAYEFYRDRKRRVRKPLLKDAFFKRFKKFIEWRIEK